jgi:hypothetical protein
MTQYLKKNMKTNVPVTIFGLRSQQPWFADRVISSEPQIVFRFFNIWLRVKLKSPIASPGFDIAKPFGVFWSDCLVDIPLSHSEMMDSF